MTPAIVARSSFGQSVLFHYPTLTLDDDPLTAAVMCGVRIVCGVLTGYCVMVSVFLVWRLECWELKWGIC